MELKVSKNPFFAKFRNCSFFESLAIGPGAVSELDNDESNIKNDYEMNAG
jgi:hypothetical protein